MVWHYNCPNCRYANSVEWDDLQVEKICPRCKHTHFPPVPGEDHYAYIGSEKWPRDMEEAVLGIRGTTCAVPGCYHEYEALVHKHPISKGGRTSVDNLLPMCHEHARAKGQQEYDEWVKTLPKASGAPEVPFEITFTTGRHAKKKDEPASKKAPAVGAYRPPTTKHKAPQPIAQGVNLEGELPPGAQLVAATPFIPGGARKLVLHYGWSTDEGGPCRVTLAAWPLSEQPELLRGLEQLKNPHATNEHGSSKDKHGAGKLEVDVDGREDEPWVVAAFAESKAGKPVVRNYLLFGTE